MKNEMVKKVGIITFPISDGFSNLKNFITTIEPLCSYIAVITGNLGSNSIDSSKTEIFQVSHKKSNSSFFRVLNYFKSQFKVAYELTINLREINLLFFHTGGSSLIIPIFVAKLLGKKVIIVITANPSKITSLNSSSLDSKIICFFERINYRFSDLILTLSEGLKQRPELIPYEEKISMSGARFVDTNLFSPKIPLLKRKTSIIYIGRLSKEKGLLNFIEAVQLLSMESIYKIYIIGGGELEKEISYRLSEKKMNKICVLGTKSHREVAYWLNRAKLLVLPSYTECLPNVVLEAMACGTPVLATPVGAIPNLIEDGKTGFIMNDNSPESIASNIRRALDHPNPQKVSKNARKVVEKEFTYEVAVDRYSKILLDINKK